MLQTDWLKVFLHEDVWRSGGLGQSLCATSQATVCIGTVTVLSLDIWI